jgi:hypothetical protein
MYLISMGRNAGSEGKCEKALEGFTKTEEKRNSFESLILRCSLSNILSQNV